MVWIVWNDLDGLIHCLTYYLSSLGGLNGLNGLTDLLTYHLSALGALGGLKWSEWSNPLTHLVSEWSEWFKGIWMA